METYFATPERTDPNALASEIETVSKHPVIAGLLNSISGLLAVLDEHRQLIALNDSFLKTLGICDPAEALGLRLGEAVGCIHAHEEPAGCGTSKYCSTCGAAIAIVSSLEQDMPMERICSIIAKRADTTIDIALLVRSNPIRVDGNRYILIFLQDISVQQQRAALERTFFHDVNNLMMGINGACEVLAQKEGTSNLVSLISRSSSRLMKEIQIQKCLMNSEHYSYQPVRHEISPRQVIEDLRAFFAHHPTTHSKNLQLSTSGPNLPFTTDSSLLLRVLCNMIMNALEATDLNGTVKVWYEQNSSMVSFCVWNDTMIEHAIALRIFQRNFSTKGEAGRGVGTYSMKLFGEQILGGQVHFTSTQAEGTLFTFSLPAQLTSTSGASYMPGTP